MSWCYPTEGSFKLRMRQVRNNYDKWLEKAQRLQEWVQEEFQWDRKHEELNILLEQNIVFETGNEIIL